MFVKINYNIMKLYHFNPNDYGLEWFVMSDSEEGAINALNEHLKNEFLKKPLVAINYGAEPLQWGDKYFQKKVLNGIIVDEGYSIDVYEPNQVIESEIS
jgi:hypothetical protein